MRSYVRLETWNRVSTWISRYQRRDLCGIRRKREDSIPCSSHKYTQEELNRYRRSFCRIQYRMAQSVRGVSSRFGSKMRPDGRILFSQRPEFLISRTICRCCVNIHLIARTHTYIYELSHQKIPLRSVIFHFFLSLVSFRALTSTSTSTAGLHGPRGVTTWRGGLFVYYLQRCIARDCPYTRRT